MFRRLRPSLNRLPSLRPAVRSSQPRPGLRACFYAPPPGPGNARVWLRSDGTPRSRIAGLVTKALALTCAAEAYLLYLTLPVVPVDFERNLLTSFVHIQRVDYDRYATAQLDDFGGALSYLENLTKHLRYVGVPGQLNSAAVFRRLAQEDAEDELRTRVHEIARGAAEAVHGILSASKDDEAAKTAGLAVNTVLAAMLTLLKVLAALDVDKQLHAMRLQEEMKDSSKNSESEILG
ncbi:hypothetical protein DFH07DRAFT_822041 [Mycena maculata]|uniref:Uncharacterized protein n=1 Tax=Mycena maculata TaxID=230809 RepID=A0AAD7J201_9AGAR|nr:hypothetical protein DFH07DRAFT_822041 [Mycena maculata]